MHRKQERAWLVRSRKWARSWRTLVLLCPSIPTGLTSGCFCCWCRSLPRLLLGHSLSGEWRDPAFPPVGHVTTAGRAIIIDWRCVHTRRESRERFTCQVNAKTRNPILRRYSRELSVLFARYSRRVNQSGACSSSDVITSGGRKSETTMEDKVIVVVCGYPELYIHLPTFTKTGIHFATRLELPKYSRLQSGWWGGATLGAGRHVSLHPPPIPLVYTANLIGVDPSMCINLYLIWPYYRNIMC